LTVNRETPGQRHRSGLEAALEIAGGKWKPLVLWNLASGSRRFGELRRLVPGISEKMLTQMLHEMQDDQIVSRKDFQEVPPRVAYSLTTFWKIARRGTATFMQLGHKTHEKNCRS
jgi:DNA-binding HxlR family transcriptional regulator